MAIKAQDMEFRHPDTAAYLRGLTEKSAVDPDRLRGDPARTENNLHHRPVPRPRICVRRRAGRCAGRGQTGGVDGLDQEAAGRPAGQTGRRRSEAAPPVRGGRGLHPHLRGQYGPDALRPLPEARIAGRIRHRESACKRIVGSWLKGSGRRWSKAGANAVLAAGCCLENRRLPTSSIGGIAAPQQPDPRKWDASCEFGIFELPSVVLGMRQIKAIPVRARIAAPSITQSAW